MAVVRSPDFLRALNQRDCACNIDPPASSYAIMRRAGPYRGENSGPGKDDRGELDTEIARFFASSQFRETALATLIYQRLLTPLCGRQAPTAGGTVGPARIIADSCTEDVGISE